MAYVVVVPAAALSLLACLHLALALVEFTKGTPGLRPRAIPSTDPNDIDFYLYYDKKNPETADRLIVGDTRSVRSAHFVIGQPLIFVTHGFLASHKSASVTLIKNAYLKAGFVNIIVPDWSRLASSPDPQPVSLLSYLSVVEQGVPITGRRICQMILFLVKAQIITGPEQVHLVGFSLGAHVTGIAAKCVKRKAPSGESVDRVTGLDPAGPLFKYMKRKYRLDASDATFVDVLHTDIGMLGSDLRLGTIDFYANGGGGWSQPNCLNATLNVVSIVGDGIAGTCSHLRASEYFARSIVRTPPELYGCRCARTRSFVLPSVCVSPKKVCRSRTLFGQYVPRTARGTFYIDVEKNLPGLGEGE